MANKHTISDLYQMQSLPLKDKIRMTQRRIEEWYEHYDGQVYVSFSGGKDSTVLLHLVRELYPDVPAVFVDTGLEYPEIRKFVMQQDNVTILKPKMNMTQVIKKYGYPIFSKEIAECVYGARKYLTSLIKQGTLDRPTDRPTDLPYSYNFEKLCGVGIYSNDKKSSDRQQQIWEAIKYSEKIGIHGGGQVRRFGLLSGVLTVNGTIDKRPWENYQKFQSAENDGNSSEKRDGNDGEYP